MIKINSQKDLEILLSLPNWEEAFIREWYLLSPSYIDPDNQGTVAPDSAPMMYVLICTSELNCPGIELLFIEVEQIYFAGVCALNPRARFRNDHVLFSFYGEGVSDIQSASLYYRILGKDCWGWNVRYGIKNIFDEGGFLITENL